MRFSELIERVRGRGVQVSGIRSGADPEIRAVCEDSRKVQAGDLFIARSGTKTDGAKFVSDAIAKGAVAIVTCESPGIAIAGSVAHAEVKDVNLAGAILAHEVAGNPTGGMKVIGITGTKGKTTVAYLMRSVLKAAGHTVGMIGTVEIDDGKQAVPADMTTPGAVDLVALFSRMKANGVTHCVMEVSSHALHQHRVAGIDFAVAIFTNLTGDHLDYHKTMEEYAAAKAMLFEGLKKDAVAVVNGDDKWMDRMVRGCRARVARYQVTEKGVAAALASWTAEIESLSTSGMGIYLSGPGVERYPIRTMTLIGRHNAANLLSVFAAACELKIDPYKVFRSLKNAPPPPGRLQAVYPSEGLPRFAIFVDYAHTHDALQNVLTALRATMGGGSSGPSANNIGGTPMPRLICLFGCGGDRDRSKRPKMGAVAERLADEVIVTSDNPRTENPGSIIDEICAGFTENWRTKGSIHIEPDRRAAIRLAIGMARPGDVVVLAGKGHENYQIIGTTKHHFDDVEEAEAALRGAGAAVEMAGGVAP